MREIEPDFGQSTSGLLTGTLTGEPPRDTVIASLLGELQQLRDAPTVLILDDFQAVDESPDATELVARLIRDAPSSMSFVLSSRSRPPLLLARLAGMGELAELSTEDLRFSITETEQLFADGYKQPLDADVLTVIDARTEGWAASLQLFYSSTHGRTSSAIRSLARSLTGASGQLYDFLAEEVLSNLPDELADFLLRSALLLRIVPDQVAAVFPVDAQPSSATLGRWFEEADRLGVFSRTSSSSDARQLHPLLREFLLREVAQRLDAEEIRSLHFRVARGMENVDPLVACHHYIEASEPSEAMRCLATSAVLTIGSGRWGLAANLIHRLEGVPASPAVVVIQARRILEEGDNNGARELLRGIQIAGSAPEVRAVYRQAKLSLAFRTADLRAMAATLDEIGRDPETPAGLREIASMYADTSPYFSSQATMSSLATRLKDMALSQAALGQGYFAAICLHDAAIASAANGRFKDAIDLAAESIDAFTSLNLSDAMADATHAVIAFCALELGDGARAEQEIQTAITSERDWADVYAECAYALEIVGEREQASRLLQKVEILERQGRTDSPSVLLTTLARTLPMVNQSPSAAAEMLGQVSPVVALDLGYNLERTTVIALARLLAGDTQEATALAEQARQTAKTLGARRAEVRLALIVAMAREDESSFRSAIVDAAAVGELALLHVADAIGRFLWLVRDIPDELRGSVSRWPKRWSPVLRHQLEAGASANAFLAASLLDQYGSAEDVGRLRAFGKTYRRQVRGSELGRALGRRLSPPLVVRDLGRTSFDVADRTVILSMIRRKAASLLMFLVTRPQFTAAREQLLEELWPDSRPASASNSLNQSLYFLRRDIDPWYEDDLSVDYVIFEGDLLWLDPGLVHSESAEFMAEARQLLTKPFGAAEALEVMDRYGGPFSPEFEYEDWAIAWRSRVHASYLDFAHAGLQRLVAQGDLQGARDVALRVLASDPAASDIERGLIWVYWRLGATSAALAVHHHIEARDHADGLDPPSLKDLISGDRPH